MKRLFSARRKKGKERSNQSQSSAHSAIDLEAQQVQPQRGQTQPAKPPTSRELLRSWSLRTNRLCLADAGGPRTLNQELAEQDPGIWQDAFSKNLQSLLEEEIVPFDVTFQVTGVQTPVVIKAHRCILDARNFSLLTPSLDGGDDGHVEITVEDAFFAEDPDRLRKAVAACYGIGTKTTVGFELATKRERSVSADYRNLLSDLSRLDPSGKLKRSNQQGATQGALRVPPPPPPSRDLPPTDVKIVGSAAASSDAEVEWTVFGHKALLCAHSGYFRAALARSSWSIESEAKPGDQQTTAILRLDSTQFTKDVTQELVSGCYGAFSRFSGEADHTLMHLIDAASYLGMNASSLYFEEELGKRISTANVASMFTFAENSGSQRLRLECQKFLCLQPRSIANAPDTLKELQCHQVETILRCNHVEMEEDEILDLLLTWSERSGASFDDTKELVSLVRLPFIHVDSPVMTKAVERNLVGEDMLRLCGLFQTDGEYRATMMNCEPMYRPRRTASMLRDLERKVNPPPVDPVYHDFVDHAICRMLGTVNGRNNFEKIRSVQESESGDGVVCSFSGCNMPNHTVDFPFDGIQVDTPGFPSPEQRVDRVVLESLPVNEVKGLLAAMLKYEDSLRLHPSVQAALGRIGEDEQEMSNFTTALQASVAKKFNVDPAVGIELIRSATSLFPEIAKLAHYVRFNRCFRGSLGAGNVAPDVSLLSLGGQATTLWTEINKRRGGGEATMKPVVIIGASFT